jgi:hypothetical protein
MIFPLIDLTPLVAFIVALGVCLLVAYFARAFFGTAAGAVGWIPYLGKVLSRSLLDVEHKITSIMGRAAVALEARIGASWHSMARLVDHIGRELAAHAHLLLLLSQLLPGANAIENVLQLIHTLRSRAGAIERALHGIGHDVIGRIHAVERGIGADVLPRIKSLEREVNGVTTRHIPGLRAGERVAEREITNLWKWTRTHTLEAGTVAFAGAVAVALAKLGMTWLRCNSVSRIGKRLGCRGFGILEDLLFGVIDVLVIADLCRLTGVMIDVAESTVIQDALGGIIAGIDGLLLCQGVTRPDVLDGYWTDPPPPQAFSVLPAV